MDAIITTLLGKKDIVGVLCSVWQRLKSFRGAVILAHLECLQRHDRQHYPRRWRVLYYEYVTYKNS